jgi:bla regulator protein BlaR1
MIATLGTEVVNHLWQSTVVAFAAALLAFAFRKNRAHVRHGLWFTASIKFLVPFALLMAVGNDAWNSFATEKLAHEVIAPTAVVSKVAQITEPFSDTLIPTPVASRGANWLSASLFTIWICGCLAIIAMRLCAWLRVRAAVRASKPVDIAAPITIRTSSYLLEPGVVGFVRPTLLMPEGILETLSARQLEAVLAHELAHVRRRDNLIAAIHMVVEAIFWFYPPVWWVGARLIDERERACDESVLNLGNEPRDYAEAIVGVCKLCVESPLACISGVTGADLKGRIHSILAGRVGRDLKFTKKAVLVAAGIAVVSAPILVGAMRAQTPASSASVNDSFTFEVASIKPDPDPQHYQGVHIDMGLVGAEYIATGVTAKDLIQFAYSVDGFQVSGGPAWIKSDKYAINAKVDRTLMTQWNALAPAQREKKEDQIKSMFRNLLADRFQLKVSHQSQQGPTYALVVAKGGSKLALSNDVGESSKGPGSHVNGLGNSVFQADENDMLIGAFAKIIQRQPELEGRLVEDQTGLDGRYTFLLKWTRQPTTADASSSDASPADPSAPSLWTALQEQLGLRLQSTKGQVDTIVIDHIEKPSAN